MWSTLAVQPQSCHHSQAAFPPSHLAGVRNGIACGIPFLTPAIPAGSVEKELGLVSQVEQGELSGTWEFVAPTEPADLATARVRVVFLDAEDLWLCRNKDTGKHE